HAGDTEENRRRHHECLEVEAGDAVFGESLQGADVHDKEEQGDEDRRHYGTDVPRDGAQRPSGNGDDIWDKAGVPAPYRAVLDRRERGQCRGDCAHCVTSWRMWEPVSSKKTSSRVGVRSARSRTATPV